jgi:hypothetical protein
VHLDGVKRLIDLRGGFQGFQRKAIEGVVYGSFWRAIRTRTKPVLSLIPGSLDITDEQFSQLLTKCDPSISRLGEAFLDESMACYFDAEMLELLRDARRVWV